MVNESQPPFFYKGRKESIPEDPEEVLEDENGGYGDYITPDIEVSLGGLIRLAFAIFGVAAAAGESQVELTRQRALSEGRPTLLTLSDAQESRRRILSLMNNIKRCLLVMVIQTKL